MPTKAEGLMADLAKTKKARGVLLPELEAVALRNSGPDPDRRADVLHPSEMAKEDWCYRASYYRIKHNREIRDEKFSFQMQMIFGTGNTAHAKYQDMMRQTGKLWGDWRCMICKNWERACLEPDRNSGGCCSYDGHLWEYKEVSLFHGLVSGHEDGAMDDYLVEIKTIGTGTIRHDSPKLLAEHYKELADGGKVYDIDSLWKAITRPVPTHVRQANIYLWLAKQMGLPFSRVRFLYELKHNSATKEFVVPLSERVMKPILTGIDVVTYALEQGEPPACNQGGSCTICAPYEREFGTRRSVREIPDTEQEFYGANEESSPAGAGTQPGTASGRRVVRRRGAANEAGDRPERVGSPPGGDAPRVTRRRDGFGRPRADAAVHKPEQVDPVLVSAGGGSVGRRVVRRKSRSEG